MMVSSGQVDLPDENAIYLGELSLDGNLRHTTGILSMISVLRDQGFTKANVPAVDAPESALVEGVEVYPVPNLAALIEHFRGENRISPISTNGTPTDDDWSPPDAMNLADVKGQDHAKRALEVAAAGFHNLLFNGPPDSGKTMLARCLPSILPRITSE